MVDGTDPDPAGSGDGRAVRWVVCDGCGVRPEPQGNLDPNEWRLGAVYNGPWSAFPPSREQFQALKDGRPYPPGPWPRRPDGDFSAQLVLGPQMGGAGIGLELGCAGNEQTISVHLRTPLISMYLHTERIGAWWQRRLIPTGTENREVECSLDYGYLRWTIWADSSGSTRDLPCWRSGSILVDPRDLIFGQLRYDYTDVSQPVQALLHMPHGDQHPITLTLRRARYGRRWGRGKTSWLAHWEIPDGVVTKPGRSSGTVSSGNWVSDDSVQAGAWPFEALASIAQRLTHDRIRNGYLVALPDGSVRE